MKLSKQANITVVFNRKNKLNADGNAMISLDVSYGGKRRYVPTGFAVKPSEFDEKQRRVKNHKSAPQINNRIDLQIREIRDRELALITNGDYYTIDDLLTDKGDTEKNFLDYARKEANRRPVTPHQKSAYRTLFRDLENFCGKYIPFDRLTIGFIKDFDQYLRGLNPPLHPNTVAKRHILMKSFVNAAIDEKLLEIDPYLRFKSKRVETERFALTEKELATLETIHCPDNKTELVKDLFLFGCYTGLRFEDIMELTPKSITKTEDGKVFLHTRENKTQKLKDIPLHELFNGKAIPIVDKYANKYRDTLFPIVTNQHANRILKGFALALSTDKPLTFHISRHTFGTIIAEKTGDPYLVKELMNHSDIHTSMRYTHTAKNNLEKKLSGIEW